MNEAQVLHLRQRIFSRGNILNIDNTKDAKYFM